MLLINTHEQIVDKLKNIINFKAHVLRQHRLEVWKKTGSLNINNFNITAEQTPSIQVHIMIKKIHWDLELRLWLLFSRSKMFKLMTTIDLYDLEKQSTPITLSQASNYCMIDRYCSQSESFVCVCWHLEQSAVFFLLPAEKQN